MNKIFPAVFLKLTLLFPLILIFSFSKAQVIKDLDDDGVKDSVFYDVNKGVISCKLSSRNFKPIFSRENLSDEINANVKETKSGFEFFVNYMRAGNASQFRYEPTVKTIQLIGMSRYEFGPATNDGSGESSVNLLTNNYIGEWNHWDEDKTELIKMPTIKTKMYFKKVSLNNYDGASQADFIDKCSTLYYKAKKKM